MPFEDASRATTHYASDGPLRLRRRILRAQLIAGLCFWALTLGCIAGALMELATTEEAEAARNGWLGQLNWILLAAPPAFASVLQGGVAQRTFWVAAGIFASVFCAAAVVASGNWLAALVVTAILGLLALVPAVFLSPAARGAGPSLVVALCSGAAIAMAMGTGIYLLLPAVPDDAPMTAGRTAVEIALLLAMILVTAAASAWVLRITTRHYEAKQFSELQLALRAFWGLIALVSAGFILMAAFADNAGNDALHFVCVLVVLWWLYGAIQRWWLRRIVRRAAAPLGPLLLLRVFKKAGRSEAFMDHFLAYWRFAAPVWMIAGADLAGAYMEPSEFFAFLRRRLDGLFVQTTEEIRERIQRLDEERDPDGRFRVNELFCSNATWKPTVLALIARAGVVMLDLREYTSQRAGTRYEIFHIMNLVSVEKVVALIGATDDAKLIDAELRSAWAAMSHASPNRRVADATLRVMRLRSGSRTEIRGLFAIVGAIAAPVPSHAECRAAA